MSSGTPIIDKSPQAADEFLRQRAGSRNDVAMASLNLGIMYACGISCRQSYTKSEEYFDLAYKQGLRDCGRYIYINYNMNPDKDSLHAQHFLKMAAKYGYAKAKRKLTPAPAPTSTSTPTLHVCGNCGTQAKKMKKCGRCFSARYCNVDCQRKQWSTHSKVCKAKTP